MSEENATEPTTDVDRATKAAELRAELELLEGHDVAPAGIIDEDGNAVDGDDEPVAYFPESVTVNGTVFRFKVPNRNAMLAFGLGASDRRHGERQMKTMTSFIGFHVFGDDFDEFLERLADPSDSFGEADFSELMNAISSKANEVAEAQPANGPQGR